jgi:hypothetical protein
VPRLTVQMLKNGTFYAPVADATVTLIDGRYETPSNVVDIYQIAFGDLDSDGVEDAAIALAEWSGGTADYFTVHAILNRNGVPFQSAYEWNLLQGGVGKMSISQGRIIAEGKTYGPHDGNCCPSVPGVEKWQLISDGHLVLRWYSITPEGQRQEIRIDDPAEGTAISCSVRVQGSVSYLTSWGVLYYSIKNMTGEELAIGSFVMQSDGKKTGGTFDVSIDLAMIPAGETVLVNICDPDYDTYEFLHKDDPTVSLCGYYIRAMDSKVLLVV